MQRLKEEIEGSAVLLRVLEDREKKYAVFS